MGTNFFIVPIEAQVGCEAITTEIDCFLEALELLYDKHKSCFRSHPDNSSFYHYCDSIIKYASSTDETDSTNLYW